MNNKEKATKSGQLDKLNLQIYNAKLELIKLYDMRDECLKQ